MWPKMVCNDPFMVLLVKVASSQKVFHFDSILQNLCQITILHFFSLGWKVEDSYLAHFWGNDQTEKLSEIKPPLYFICTRDLEGETYHADVENGMKLNNKTTKRNYSQVSGRIWDVYQTPDQRAEKCFHTWEWGKIFKKKNLF